MTTDPSEKPLSPWWRHAVILVMVFGFSVLTMVTVLTYTNAPPIPERVTDAAGTTLFTRDDVEHGQEVFLKYGLMEHGTLWGHGAYLGPDYSAEYLHRLAEVTRDALARERHGRPYAELDPDAAAGLDPAVTRLLKENRYDPASGTLRFSAAEAAAWRIQKAEWAEYFSGPTPAPGLPAKYIRDAGELEDLNSYFAWAAWATVANRPGKDYSYTNNWPYEPAVGNRPSSSTYLWSALSLVTLLGGLGVVLLVVGRFDYLGWHGTSTSGHAHDSALARWTFTPSQKAVGLYFGVVALLFLLQALAGGALAHYRVESGAFYGFDLARYLPYNLLRTFHLQLAIFWIATAWVAGGLFLAPIVGGAEPRGQRAGVLALLAALAVVVFGSLGGEWLGINDRLGDLWFWFGHQGSEYLDLGRFWQLLLAVGLAGWLVLMYRALRPAIRDPRRSELTSLFLYAAAAIPLFYLPALFYGPRTNFAVIDNWRFWIIHLWVEGFFELFATVLVAVMFVVLGMVTARTATRVIYLDAILYLTGGIVGTGHHWYFTGQGTLNMGLAACFSALEVVPLTLLTLDAWDFIRLRERRCEDCQASFADRHRWAIYFLMAVGFWNFVGAGVFGFLINLPIVSYFEVGHRAHQQPRPRRALRRLRHAGARGARLLPALARAGRGLGARGALRPDRLLGSERGSRPHDGGRPLPGRRAAALGRPPERVLARATAHLPDERPLPHARVGPLRGRHGLPRGRRRAARPGGRGPAPRLEEERGDGRVTPVRPQVPSGPTTRVPWRAVALPAEHGGWGLLAEPALLGLVLAPSGAGACLALAALSAFLARHPLRLWFLDRRKKTRYPRTALAELFLSGYVVVALLLVAAAFALATSPFWPVLAAAAPLGLCALTFDALGRSREAFPEAVGAVALGASATAIALAGGAPAALAWAAWALLALRAVTTVLYVRARIRLDRGVAAGPRAVHVGHAVALVVATGLASAGWAPWLAVVVFVVLLLRSAWGLSSRRRPVRPQVLGFQELGYGVLTVALLAVGYRVGA